MTGEQLTFLRLKCTMTHSYHYRRYYWRDPVGDHETNIILFAEERNNDGKWEVVYEDQSLERFTFGV
jgi:hypothetical protein